MARCCHGKFCFSVAIILCPEKICTGKITMTSAMCWWRISIVKYAPIEKNVSVDESMLPYFGRHECKQFIRNKPVRFGFKAWVLALVTGYCVSFTLYQGKGDYSDENRGLGESVVMYFWKILSIAFPATTFSFFCDNFFTSTRLISIMTKKKTLVTGTARVNRIGKCPLEAVQNYKKKSQKSFSSKFNKKHRIFACRWKDNNVVTMLSNQFGAKPTKKAERYSRKQHKKVAVEQPNLIYQYNKFMGGVDLMDNHVANYRISMRGKKWYIPIFLWMMDSHVQCLGTIKGDRLEAGPTSVQALLVKYSTEPTRPGAQKRGGARKVPIPARKGEGHLVTSLLLRQRCLLCKSKTVKKCVKCGPLPDKCFLDFHSS